MPPRPSLSKSELLVARTIWQLGNATVGQVFEALSSESDIDYSTVQTYIRRLEQKGYINAKRNGRTKVYSPKVRPGQVIKETVDDLMNRLFDGELIPLMKHLIQDRDIRPEQIEELRNMLREVEAQEDDDDADDK
jgi:predicted transcriptional regulator